MHLRMCNTLSPSSIQRNQKLNLKARSSLGFFSAAFSYTPVTNPNALESRSSELALSNEYTPKSGSSKVATQSHGPPPQEVVQNLNIPPTESIISPFLHTGAITRNLKFFGQTDVLNEIDYAFGLNYRP
ncbi:hypothetical protein B0O99DRAFT_594535 [Bisporella sp. PMI_857]|nr:hypothetical protein B0O99DRAFT_594535 [Bisporella sp. PMI_857]